MRQRSEAELNIQEMEPTPRLMMSQARSRLERLVDPGTIHFPEPIHDDSVVVASGLIDGNAVRLFACDGQQAGGALGGRGSEIIVRAIESAVARACPVIGIWHSGGAKLQEGTSALDGIGRVFHAIVHASGRIPQVSVVLGPAAGGAAYGPALTDFVVAGPGARIFVTGPEVVHQVTGEVVDAQTLGGPDLHSEVSGVVHAVGDTDSSALGIARALVQALTPHAVASAGLEPDPRMDAVLPGSSRRAYDMHEVIDLLLDPTPTTMELHRSWARNVVTVLGNLHGRPVGVLANNPMHVAGCLDATGSEKAARFVRGCDALGVPLVVLVDTPGYLPGRAQESDGVVRRGAKLLHAFAEAEVPRVTVIMRKAYGGAFISMNSKSLGAAAVLAWPCAEVGVMHPSAAVRILNRRDLDATSPAHRDELHLRFAADYEAGVGGLRNALEKGHLDRVIQPSDTRRAVAGLLASLPSRRGDHGNGPL
jgi:acetyl-CoA/propionyl-CoA carboxylase carboxyl transferase subunit